jgi:hypothetical protein
MKELIRTPNIVVISALKAALTGEEIEVFEFDGPIADTLAGIGEFPRRLFVHEDDYPRHAASWLKSAPKKLNPHEFCRRTCR